MRRALLSVLAPVLLGGAVFALSGLSAPSPAEAVVCAKGVYRAGCAGPNGAVTTTRRPAAAAGCRYVNGRRVCGVVR
ncbi:MAG: hypothetical protein U1E62_14400 [Alsobacter sp.]